MMKKVLLLNLFSLAILSMFAQTQVGYTTYDLQTNNANCRRVATNAAGEVVITYTRSHAFSEAAPDRGTGYNYKNALGVWSEPVFPATPGTFTRHDIGRVGWSNIGFFGTKELAISHFADDANSFGGLQIQQRDLGSAGPWVSTQLNSNNPNGTYSDDATWPRVAISGDSIFVISSVQIGTFVNGVDGGIYSHVSYDGGATWTEGVIPFINGNNFTAIGADAYAIDANDNGVIAIAVGRYNAFMLKSTDFGATWTTTTMIQTIDANGMPTANNFSGANGESAMQADISDESYSVVVDDNGMVHVWMGKLEYQKEDPFQDGTVIPFSEGLMYWNETMTEPMILHASRFTVEAGAGCDPLFPTTVIQDPDFIQFSLYSSSFVSQPSGSYNDNGDLVVAYSRFRTAIIDSNDDIANATSDGFLFKDVYLLKSSDNGATWEGPINVSNNDSMECAYPGVPRKYFNDVVPVIWQQDARPGNALQVPTGYSHNYIDNMIMYSEVNVASVATPADETCPVLALLDAANSTITVAQNCLPTVDELQEILVLDDVPQGPDESMIRVVGGVPPSTAVPGMITVDLYLEDDASNTSDTVTITLDVVADVTAPTFTFNGPDSLQVVVGNPFVDPGLVYMDNGCDPTDAPDTTDNVNPALVPGTFTYEYEIEDNSGNITTAVRYVTVIGSDTEGPIITLNGMDTVVVEACTFYNEEGATAYDLVDFDRPVTIDASAIDINTVGFYNVIYSSMDNSSNPSTSTRVVSVEDNTAPVLNIIDDNDLVTPADSYTEGGINYTYEGTTFVSPATTASDPNCNASNPVITFDDSNVDETTSGNYSVTYTAVDENGNPTTQSLTVRVGKEPTPDFTFIATSTGLILTNTSSDNPTTYAWDFGNGQTSTQANSSSGIPSYSSTDATYPSYDVCLTVRNRFNDAPFNKPALTECKTVMIPVGIADIAVLDAAVSIFPNPSNGLLNVEISDTEAESLTVEITNVLGTVVATQNLSEVNDTELVKFNLEGAAAGLYFVNISSDDAAITKRVLIK